MFYIEYEWGFKDQPTTKHWYYGNFTSYDACGKRCASLMRMNANVRRTTIYLELANGTMQKV